MENNDAPKTIVLSLLIILLTLTPLWAASPQARWKMNDNTADTCVFDDSTNRHHGTFAGSTNPNTSYHHSPDCSEGSGSLVFDGEYDYIQISGYKGITGTASRTCTAWIKTHASQQGAIICWGTSAIPQKWIFRVEEGGALGVGIYGGWIRTATAPLGDNTWHHVAAVMNNDGTPNVNEVLLYIDGVLQSTNSNPVEIDTGDIQDVMIGAHREDIGGGGIPNMYFMGLMDEVRIYDYALSSEEIYLLQALNPPPDETNVSANSDIQWPTEEGALSYDIYLGTSQSSVAGDQQLLSDINGDGSTDIVDLSILADQWLENGSADIVDDDIVNMADFAALAATWGLDTSFKGNQTDTTFDPGTLEYNTTYYWRIDTVNASGTTTGSIRSFTTLPESASSPSPGDAAANVPTSTDLSWTAGSGAMSYDVYFGSTSPGTFQGNQTDTTFEPNTLGGNATYYWRIDEVNEGGTAMGTVWSFATVTGVPTSASLLSPANTENGVPINAKLNWTAGVGAASHDVYFGTTSPGTFQGNQTGTTFDPGILNNETTYYWRIDEVNSYGTTTGTVWSFTTDFLRLKPEEFAIHAWNHFFGFDLEVFKGIYDCGFNLAGFVNPEDLDLVDAAGLKAHIWDYEFYGDYDNIFQTSKEEKDAIAQKYANLVGDHPALFGYFLRDEPPIDNSAFYSGLAEWVDAFHTADPGKQAYVNLVWISDFDQYVSEVKNDFLSYDYYGGVIEDETIISEFFPCLEKAYLASAADSQPIWNTVCSMKLIFPDHPEWNTVYPSLGSLRFQAFGSLAYGVRGISWFVYFPADPAWDSLTPIDLAGNKTDIWYMLRDVNFQLHRIGQIYITLNSVNVFHYPNVPSGTPDTPYPSQGISSSHHVDSLSGGDFCVGEFNDPSGHPYIMLVNKSLTDTSNFNVTFKQAGTMYWVNSATGQLETLEASEMYLAPGEGMLITVQ